MIVSELAACARNTEVRQTLLYLAERWRDFAEQAEFHSLGQTLEPPPPIVTS
jgi:hypothetical protein